MATKGALVALVAAPLLQKAVALATASGSVPFLPTAYIDIPSVIGYPAYAIGGNISQVEGLSFEGAVAAFGAGCLAAAAAAGLLGLLSRRPLPAGGGRPAALEVDGLGIRYGRKVVCEGVSFDVRAEDVVGLVAPNGYGKTSVLCAIGGNGPFQQGRVSADGFDKRRSRARFRRKVLLLPDRGQILHPELTVREHLKLASALWGTGRPWEEAARRCGALPFEGVRARELSQGMGQLASLTVACASGAAYYLFDEPTNGLDRTNGRLFEKVVAGLRDRGAGVLLSSPDLEGLDSVCDSVILPHDAWVHQADIDDRRGCVELYNRYYGPTKEEKR